MSSHSSVRNQGSPRSRWWPVAAVGVAFLAFVGVAIADQRLRRPFPTLNMNEEWGDGLLETAAQRPGATCGDGGTDEESLALRSSEPRTRTPPPPRPLVAQTEIPWMIESQLKRTLPDTRRCFNAAQHERPELSGEWTFLFTILPSGATGGVSVVGDTQRDTTLETCLAELVQGWSFYPIDRPQPVTFKLPIERPAEREERPSLSDPAAIDRMVTQTLKRSERRFERCDKVVQDERPDQVGPRTLRFVLQPNGVPAQVQALSDRPEPDGMETCFIGVVKGLRFESVHEVQTVTVQLPLGE